MYTDGSNIKGPSRLLAAVVHVSTCTTIYINAGGIDETRTIMGAKLVTIYTALDKFATHEGVDIFIDSVSSLQAIRHRYTNSGTHGPHHYHRHMLLLSSITYLLEEKSRQGFSTTSGPTPTSGLMTSRIHPPNWRSHNMTPYGSHKKVDVEEVAPRPPYLVMYTAKPPPSPTYLGTSTRMTTL